MTRSDDHFSDVAVDVFGRRFGLFLGQIGYDGSAVRANTMVIQTLLTERRQDSLRFLRVFLQRSDIGRRWNGILDVDRAPFLAKLIAPHLVGTVLDLLCGNGSVARSLARLTGRPVAMVERTRGGGAAVESAIARFDDFRVADVVGGYDTVLLCTVLHHESEPAELLGLAARAARRRIVIVENCIDAGCPMDYQELIDLIFNESLNETSLPCPGSHKPLADWLMMGARYGRAKAVATVAAAPGIPLSHDLIVIELTP